MTYQDIQLIRKWVPNLANFHIGIQFQSSEKEFKILLMVSDVRREDEIYQMYSAIILSVYGVRSKFSRPSSLFMV